MRRLLACAVVTLALVAQQHFLRGDHPLNLQMDPKEPRAARAANAPTDRDKAFLDAVEGLRQPGDVAGWARDIIETEEWKVQPVADTASNETILANGFSAVKTGDLATAARMEALLATKVKAAPGPGGRGWY